VYCLEYRSTSSTSSTVVRYCTVCTYCTSWPGPFPALFLPYSTLHVFSEDSEQARRNFIRHLLQLLKSSSTLSRSPQSNSRPRCHQPKQLELSLLLLVLLLYAFQSRYFLLLARELLHIRCQERVFIGSDILDSTLLPSHCFSLSSVSAYHTLRSTECPPNSALPQLYCLLFPSAHHIRNETTQ